MRKKKKQAPSIEVVLPVGVPSDNTSLSEKQIAPDTATPYFSDTALESDVNFAEGRSLGKAGYPKKPPCGRGDCNAGPRCDLAGCYRHPPGWKPPASRGGANTSSGVTSGSSNGDLDWRAGLVIVALVVAMGAVFLLYNPRGDLPLCADNPDWNQYNCRAR